MEKFTKEQIDKRLAKLRESRLADETYEFIRPAMAMCYSISMPYWMSERRQCASCGKIFAITVSSDNTLKPKTADEIAEKFRRIGMEAQFRCNCDECVNKLNAARYEMLVKAGDELKWHISFPDIRVFHNENDNNDYTSALEYELVYNFLTVPEKIEDLAGFFYELYNKNFRKQKLAFYVGQECIDSQPTSPETSGLEKRFEQERAVINNPEIFYSGKPPIDFYAEQNLTIDAAIEIIKKHIGFREDEENSIFSCFQDLLNHAYCILSYKGLSAGADNHFHLEVSGFLKTQIDLALFKVLGLNIMYDMAEMRKNIALIWETDGYRGLLPLAYNALEKTGIQQFTVNNYLSFMWHIQEEILEPAEKVLDVAKKLISYEITDNTVLIGVMLEHIQQWMVQQKRVTITENELINYLHNELYPGVRFDFKTVEAAFRTKYDVQTDPDYPTLVYFEDAIEKFIASKIPERSWNIDKNYVKKMTNMLIDKESWLFVPLYKRKRKKNLSIQELITIQREINAELEKYIKMPHISIMREMREQ